MKRNMVKKTGRLILGIAGVLVALGLVYADNIWNPCIEDKIVPSCVTTGSVTLTNITLTPGAVICAGDIINAETSSGITSGRVRIVTTYTDTNRCPAMIVTNWVTPTILSNRFEVSGPDGYSTNGNGLSVSINTTNCGDGTVTFRSWYNQPPCITNPAAVAPVSTNFTIVCVSSLSPVSATGTNVYCWSSNGVVTVTAATCPVLTTNQLPNCYEFTTNGMSLEKVLSVDIPLSNAVVTTVIAKAGTLGTCAKTNVVVVMKIESETVATIPVDRTRTTIGVGEEVDLTLKPASLGTATWSLTGGGTLNPTSGLTTRFTAPESHTNCVVTAQFMGESCSKPFTVVEPASESATTNGAAPPDPFPVGSQGVCMNMIITIEPTSVSFYRVQMKEESGPASNVTGYMTNFSAAALYHSANTNWVTLSEGNKHGDHAHHTGFPNLPWGVGGFDWVIPVYWRVVDGSTSNSFPSSTQSIRMTDTNGTTSVTKLGASATRTP